MTHHLEESAQRLLEVLGEQRINLVSIDNVLSVSLERHRKTGKLCLETLRDECGETDEIE